MFNYHIHYKLDIISNNKEFYILELEKEIFIPYLIDNILINLEIKYLIKFPISNLDYGTKINLKFDDYISDYISKYINLKFDNILTL
uniref:Uncharacterized protein n=1 Tax=Pithovirus LCDPAC02 TaxID=2506601 RepID=A0A481YP15_9VIRU|nr:MAG: hypothetical protein LCDPAC02_02100 [Pithovirus LCDPAC02]